MTLSSHTSLQRSHTCTFYFTLVLSCIKIVATAAGWSQRAMSMCILGRTATAIRS